MSGAGTSGALHPDAGFGQKDSGLRTPLLGQVTAEGVEAARSSSTCASGGVAHLSLSSHAAAAADAGSAGGPLGEGQLSAAELAQLREREAGQHGCTHYRRRCLMVAPCCDEVFWCRHCHNEAKTSNAVEPEKRHELDRRAVREVVCALCSARQPLAQACRQCGVAFGAYACLTCSFFDDDLSKNQFHCNDCGICRVGGREKYFHCLTCACCYSITLKDNHVCVENSMRCSCPICFEYLFDSVQPTSVLPCGHCIHSHCLSQMTQNQQTACPICMKSFSNMGRVWERLDQEVAQTPMPSDYANWMVDILCNDCNASSTVAFHILGQKCQACGSYNTRRNHIDRHPAPGRPTS